MCDVMAVVSRAPRLFPRGEQVAFSLMNLDHHSKRNSQQRECYIMMANIEIPTITQLMILPSTMYPTMVVSIATPPQNYVQIVYTQSNNFGFVSAMEKGSCTFAHLHICTCNCPSCS